MNTLRRLVAMIAVVSLAWLGVAAPANAAKPEAVLQSWYRLKIGRAHV